MKSKRRLWFLVAGAVLLACLVVLFVVLDVPRSLEWRIDAAISSLRCAVYGCDTLPAPNVEITSITAPTPQPTMTGFPTPVPSPTPFPLPEEVLLPAPPWVKQDWNNCGPATLSLALQFYGWGGDQFDIADVVKPFRGDRNVNIEELVYFVRTQAGWLDGVYRVGGDIDTLRRFIAAGYPVIVEKGIVIESDGPDGGWAGHYLLLTGYDDERGAFLSQDTYNGADRWISYEVLTEEWEAFNYIYLVIFPVADREAIHTLLGGALDEDENRRHALEMAQQALEQNPDDAFAWFNLGTNLLYFERYEEAAVAYENALALGLPWRFLRYQFGPYITYFNLGRFNDLLDLTNATLELTTNAEESLLWRGWARVMLNDTAGGVEDFRAALEINPLYHDALYALEYLGETP